MNTARPIDPSPTAAAEARASEQGETPQRITPWEAVRTALMGLFVGAGGLVLMVIGSAVIGVVFLGLLWLLNEYVLHGPQLGAQL